MAADATCRTKPCSGLKSILLVVGTHYMMSKCCPHNMSAFYKPFREGLADTVQRLVTKWGEGRGGRGGGLLGQQI